MTSAQLPEAVPYSGIMCSPQRWRSVFSRTTGPLFLWTVLTASVSDLTGLFDEVHLMNSFGKSNLQSSDYELALHLQNLRKRPWSHKQGTDILSQSLLSPSLWGKGLVKALGTDVNLGSHPRILPTTNSMSKQHFCVLLPLSSYTLCFRYFCDIVLVL